MSPCNFSVSAGKEGCKLSTAGRCAVDKDTMKRGKIRGKYSFVFCFGGGNLSYNLKVAKLGDRKGTFDFDFGPVIH